MATCAIDFSSKIYNIAKDFFIPLIGAFIGGFFAIKATKASIDGSATLERNERLQAAKDRDEEKKEGRINGLIALDMELQENQVILNESDIGISSITAWQNNRNHVASLNADLQSLLLGIYMRISALNNKLHHQHFEAYRSERPKAVVLIKQAHEKLTAYISSMKK